MIPGIHLATALSVMLHMEQEGNGMKDRIMELAGIGDDEGILANGDSATALQLAALVLGEPSSIFLRGNGNYAARFSKNGVTISLEFNGLYTISGTLMKTPQTNPNEFQEYGDGR